MGSRTEFTRQRYAPLRLAAVFAEARTESSNASCNPGLQRYTENIVDVSAPPRMWAIGLFPIASRSAGVAQG